MARPRLDGCREPGRPFGFQDYLNGVAFGVISTDMLAEYRRACPMFDRWLRKKAKDTRRMVEDWREAGA